MKDLKLTISSLGYVVSELTKLITGNSKKSYRVSVKEWRESRSLSQNALYWKWMAEIDKQSPLVIEGTVEEEDGNLRYEVFKGAALWHEVFKKYYCPVKIITNGENQLEVKSTTLLDVGDMTFYLNKIEGWCMDRGIKLTIPDNCQYSQLIKGMDQ